VVRHDDDDDDDGMMFEGVSDIFVTYQDHHKRLRLAHLLPSPSVVFRELLEFQFGASGIRIGFRAKQS